MEEEWIYIKTEKGIEKVEKSKINPESGKISEAEVLDIVDENPGITQKKIAEKLGKSSPSVNPVLRKLVKEGKLARMKWPYEYYRIVEGPEE